MSITLASAPALVCHTGNDIKVVVTTGLPLITANLQVKLGLLVELVYDSGVYSAPGDIPEIWADPDANGDCEFFIQKYLNDTFDKLLDVPAVGGTAAVKCMHMVRRYKMYAVEYSGEPQAPTDYITTGSIVSVRYAQRGGIPVQHHALRSWFGSAGWAVAHLANPFLDWRGPSLRTGRTQDQWVYFNWQDALSTLPMVTPVRYVEYTLEDGTSASVNTTLANMDANSVWMLPCGFAQLGLPAIEVTATQKILKYRFWLQQTVGMSVVLLSEVKEFIVDHQYYEWGTEVQYMNGLATMTQLLLRGRPERETDVDMEVSESYMDNSMAQYLGQTHVHGVTVRDGVNHASGALTAQEEKLMHELIAGRKFMVKDSRLGWVPCTLRTSKLVRNPLVTARTYELSYEVDRVNEVVNMF